MRISFHHAVLLTLALLVGCADSGPGPVDLGPLVLTLENKGTSEGRPLQEIKVHTSQARYLNAPNLL
ncbi:MAG: hypothetical protein JRH20_20725, partial [Deltaproteobacteria bacterium]|nr:hypothetical protein [Deltaproteobacteria bacterium]